MLSPYFDHVERELRSAVRQRKHLPWYTRLRARHPRALVTVLAALVIAGPAAAAVSLLQSGSPIGAGAPLTPKAGAGVAVRGGELLPLRVDDPAGGPPWGMRLIRTSRGLVCLQVGRVAFGTIGVLGQDGAFNDDGRFHAFSPNYRSGPVPCPVPDARGHAFINVSDSAAPTSGLDQPTGCRPPSQAPRPSPLASLPPRARARLAAQRARPVCPAASLRTIYYGLLGPDAVSITQQTASGKLITTPTGPDGAYLIVLPYRPAATEVSIDGGLFPGAIRTVHYRDGHSCSLPAPKPYGGQLAECQPVGYVSSTGPLPTPAQVASPVRVHVERIKTKAWCVRLSPPGVPYPCRGATPRGFQRLVGGPPSALVIISWISRVPVKSGHSYYYYTINSPPLNRYDVVTACGASQASDQTDSNYTAGQRVVQSFFVPLTCHGVTHGNVTLVTTTAPFTPAGAMPAVRGQSVGREVGHYSLRIP
jgi:hypothetical protein